MTDAKQAADALNQAIATGDTTALSAVFADDVVVWHNSDRLELTKDQSLGGIAALSQIATDTWCDVVHFEETDFGFVQQFVLRGTVRTTGKPIELHNCIVGRMDGGRITRLDEYVDPTGAAQFS